MKSKNMQKNTQESPDSSFKKQEYFIYQGSLVTPFEDTLFRGYKKINLPELKSIELTYKGQLIPMEIWRQVTGFLRSSQIIHKEEAQLNLMFNMSTQEWGVWVFPQFMMGMHTEADLEDPEFVRQRNEWGPDWVVGGTVHHHCGMSAFASGTDNQDELNKDGIHITLGFMEKPTLNADVRVLYNQVKHKVKITDVVDTGGLFNDMIQNGLSDTMAQEICEKYILSMDGDFPEEWMKNLKKKNYQNQGWQSQGWQNGQHTRTWDFESKTWRNTSNEQKTIGQHNFYPNQNKPLGTGI